MTEKTAPEAPMTTTEITAPGANPLKKFFRQPKLYITMPSKGKWYPQGALEPTENMELPVYAMTAKDELTLKTPDALINGQATVDIIQSCIPNVKNAWTMPSIDVDAALIAIRIETYGDTLDLSTKAPNTNIEKTYQLDLRQLLESMGNAEFQDQVTTSQDITVTIRPVTYKEFTASALQAFEEERLFRIVNDGEMNQETKLEKFGETFGKIRDLTIGLITESIVSITVGEEVVTNRLHIKEFIENADKNTFKEVTDHIETQKEEFAVKPLKVTADKEQLEAGSPETFDVPIIFDQAHFFA